LHGFTNRSHVSDAPVTRGGRRPARLALELARQGQEDGVDENYGETLFVELGRTWRVLGD